jgi:F0F1-type ATP synthase membrane subunit c/vacuolar-type H+-ATPase subunit K
VTWRDRGAVRADNKRKIMKKILAAIALLLAFLPAAYAQETIGDKAREAKAEGVAAKRAAGHDIRKGGRKVKASARKARQAVISRCADGRHTVRGPSGCAGHGGVRDPR